MFLYIYLSCELGCGEIKVKTKAKGKTVTLQNPQRDVHTSLPQRVPRPHSGVSPVRHLDHEGRLHVYLATVDYGAVGEWTVVAVGGLQLDGVYHRLGREGRLGLSAERRPA